MPFPVNTRNQLFLYKQYHHSQFGNAQMQNLVVTGLNLKGRPEGRSNRKKVKTELKLPEDGQIEKADGG